MPAISPSSIDPQLSRRARILQNIRRFCSVRTFGYLRRKKYLNRSQDDRQILQNTETDSGIVPQYSQGLPVEGILTATAASVETANIEENEGEGESGFESESESESVSEDGHDGVDDDENDEDEHEEEAGREARQEVEREVERDGTVIRYLVRPRPINEKSSFETRRNILVETDRFFPTSISYVKETIYRFQYQSTASENTDEIYSNTNLSLVNFSDCIPQKDFKFWSNIPYEVGLRILGYLSHKELVRVSGVSRQFQTFCYDGQLWMNFDASDFYREISADSLAKILVSAGPFVHDLNIRGCIQIEYHKRADIVAKACHNLISASLEGCRNFQRSSLHNLLANNVKLESLNLTAVSAVTNSTCKIITQTCPFLRSIDVSWCTRMDSRGLRNIIQGCKYLRDLRAVEIKGMSCVELAQEIFETNRLETLVLSGCIDLTDQALQIMMQGQNPEIDILTNRLSVPQRNLRHFNISRCHRISDLGIKSLAHVTSHLQVLSLSSCLRISDYGLQQVIATTPNLCYLNLDELYRLTNDFLKEDLAKAPCITSLVHVSVSYCDKVGDVGMMPLLRAGINLRSVIMDNTDISDVTLKEAVFMVRSRNIAFAGLAKGVCLGLHMVAYDCQNITWLGIRDILRGNSEIIKMCHSEVSKPQSNIIHVKSYYCWQMTIDEHTRRLERGNVVGACRLEKLWNDWMISHEDVGIHISGVRRRRRRAREARHIHAIEQSTGDRPITHPETTRIHMSIVSCTVM